MDIDDFLAGLRRAGLLVEFTDAEWAAYRRKHFGSPVHAPLTDGRQPADPKDQTWKDEHRMEYDDPEPDA